MTQDIFTSHRARADRLMWLPLLLHTAICWGVGIFTQTLGLAVVLSIIVLPLTFLVQHKLPGHQINGFIKAAVFMGLSALLIEQSGGLIEAHFSIFIMLSALILYSDWRVIVFGGAVIALHHVLFTWLHHLGVVQLYSGMVGDSGTSGHDTYALLACLAMHGGAVVVQVSVLGYLAKVLEHMVYEGLKVRRFAEQAGNGQLNVTFTQAELALPAVAAINTMQEKVAQSLRQAQHAANEVGELSDKLFTAQVALHDQAGRNTAQTERISSSATQLTATTREGAEESRRVRELATQAERAARESGQQVQAMREVMQKLNEQASQISRMLSEIDQITFQTNLLALNASVEAARAGEHGRGFAVVANEVRQLAGKTQSTASRIREQIEQTTSNVAYGVTQTQTVQTTTQELIGAFEEVTSRLTGMDGAIQQQHQGIEELEGSVSEMHDALDVSRRSLDDAHLTAEELANTARTLMAAVGGFQLPDSPRQAVPTLAAP
ncbi:methyl-accepting chemotaxis protein [Vreelandella rituensis]|uniref:Methyl-accepting chemotaxis protein n=1 Tax=Vreelandella rituensis TaxID=2282306 RepID=A0A368TYA6_9GAMM|nr:methyl-accepting chemotaxis protein [Halomonas rituensis]RCV89571.1 methyl-accepting chemotaxis protein [Halomonas rituensis]